METETEALRTALLQLASVEQELARRRRERGIDYFIPNRPQLKALQSPARIVAYVGGNRAGKSTTGAAWLAAHLTHKYPKCACHGEWFAPTKRFARPLKAVVVVTEFAKVEQMMEARIFSVLPKDWVASLKRTPQGYMRRLVGKDGSTVDFLTGEMDEQAFESTDWDLAWVDEPTSRHRYIAIHRGLTDRQGPIMFTFTPLIEPWMKAELVDKADGRFIDVVQADTYENLEDIHGNPILTRQAVEEFERPLAEDERQTRIHGKFFHLRGIVYTEFTPSMHVREFEYAYPDPVVCVLDPHDRLPHHVLWAWVDRKDWLYVDRELVMPGTVAELRRAITATEQQAHYKIARRLIDPNFGQSPLLTTGRTVIQELAMNPFPLGFGCANDKKDLGHLKVKDYLHWDRNRAVDIQNTPRLFFHTSRVPKTIHSMQNYQYDEWKGKAQEQRDPKEKEKPKDTHGADCVRYLCMNAPTFEGCTLDPAEMELAGVPY